MQGFGGSLKVPWVLAFNEPDKSRCRLSLPGKGNHKPRFVLLGALSKSASGALAEPSQRLALATDLSV